MSIHCRSKLIRLVVSCALLLSAVDILAAPSSSDIKVTGAWIRWLPAGIPSGGYMTLTNQGSVAHTLTGARSADYAEIGIHKTENSHGMTSMHPVTSIKINPKVTVSFGEQGYHLMLMKPTHELHPGERILITLQFENEPSITVPFVACSANAANAGCAT